VENVMPVVIPTIDDIMLREKRDMLFIRFRRPRRPGAPVSPSREQHLDWFASHGLCYELAAPRGWLEGDPGHFAVYFEGESDPRIAAYSAVFEDAEGKSLAPDEYQMVIISYATWLKMNPDVPR
jgi:hypothetical protein